MCNNPVLNPISGGSPSSSSSLTLINAFMLQTVHPCVSDMHLTGGDYGDKASIGIDYKFDCVHRFDRHGVHRNPDSARAITEASLSYDLGCHYQRHHYANRWLAYRVQHTQSTIRPICRL